MAESADTEREIIHCSICFEIFKSPKYLPCLHTFCELCLQEYITSGFKDVKSTRDQFNCPICRTVVQAPDNSADPKDWAAKLPTNHLIVTLMDQEKLKSSEKSCDPCSLLGEEYIASSWCTVCGEALCDMCRKYHKTNKMSRKHHVIAIEELSSNMPLILTEEFCEKHVDKKLELFCVDHDEVCCLTCMAASHRKCDQVLVLEEAAKDVRENPELEDICKNLTNLSKDFEELLHNRKRNLKTTDTDKRKLSQEIKTLRQEINNYLDVMESQLQEELNVLHKQTTLELEDEIQDLESRHKAIDKCRKSLDVCRKHSENSSLFIERNKAQKRYKEQFEFVSLRARSMEDIEYKLNVNERASSFQTHLASLGKISLEKKISDVSLSNIATRYPLREGNALEILHFDIKQKITVSGGVFLQNGFMALVSFGYPAVLVYDCNGKFFQEVQLPEKPFDITCVEKKYLAVSFYRNSKLAIIGAEKLEIIRTISLGGDCRGVTSYKGNIIVNCFPKLYTVDDKGTVLGELTIEGDAYYITASSDKIYCSFLSPYCLSCVDMKGNQIFQYSSDDLKNPVGLSSDREGNVYVAGHLSNNVHQITPDGKLMKVILNESHGIKEPGVVAFDKSSDKFLVVCNDSPVRIFKMVR